MKSSVAIAVLLLSSQAPTVQHPSDALETELHESYEAWFAALYKGDAATMDHLEVDDFILVAADGTPMEKHRPRAVKPLPVPEGASERTWTDGILRRYGDAAILTGRITSKTPTWTTTMATTAVFVRRADKWQIASVQTPVRLPNRNQ